MSCKPLLITVAGKVKVSLKICLLSSNLHIAALDTSKEDISTSLFTLVQVKPPQTVTRVQRALSETMHLMSLIIRESLFVFTYFTELSQKIPA